MKKATSKPLLLDVNVLLALAWPNHQFHHAARARLASEETIWASCALTQLAFVRLFVTPAVVGVAKPVQEALDVLTVMVSDPRHVFWEAMPALTTGDGEDAEDAFRWVLGHRQINDAYLLALAHRHQARLLTFDQRLAALSRHADAVEVIN